MTEQLKDVRFYDQTLFRVWPDGTVQEADQAAYSWMSDDHALVWAYNEDEALAKVNVRGFQTDKLRINWWGVALAVYFVIATATLAVHVLKLIKWAAGKL